MQNLSHRISTRLNDKQYRKVQSLSNRLGISKSVALRAIVSGYNHRMPNLSLDDYSKLYRAISKLNDLYRVAYRDGNNLNQIARMENKNGYSSYSSQLISTADNDFTQMYMLLRNVVTNGSLRYRS